MRFHRPAVFALAIAVAAPDALAQEQEHEAHSHDISADVLGSVTFPNSGKASAQKPFITGLALIHSFEYPRAREAFRQAQKADPDFTLLHWMQALTNTQVIWGIDDSLAARAELKRLGPSAQARLARARTQRERAFGAAVEAFYSSGSREERARAVADSMRSWVKRMPEDHEARSFAALAIIWQAFFRRGEEAGALNAEAASHAQYVFERNPRHPGATHYLIHATDAPANAKLGLKAALAYSRIAPGSNHAHHMPSHIFLPLGMWDELVASNERSWKLGRGDDAQDASFHSLNWLQYGYLQQGRWKEARALIDTARKITDGASIDPALYPDGALAVEQLSFRYASETGDWSAFVPAPRAADLLDPRISERARGMGAYSLYQRSVVAMRRGDTTTAVNALGILEKTRPLIARRLELELRSRQSTDLDRIAALEKLRPATRVDRYVSMTPSPVFNLDEQLGEALVAAGRPKEAIAIYREALSDHPGRAALLLGLARAQEAAGDSAGARATCAELSRIWSKADADVRALLKQF